MSVLSGGEGTLATPGQKTEKKKKGRSVVPIEEGASKFEKNIESFRKYRTPPLGFVCRGNMRLSTNYETAEDSKDGNENDSVISAFFPTVSIL